MHVRDVSGGCRLGLLACVVSCLLGPAVARDARAGSAILPTGFTDARLVGALDDPVGLARVPDAPSRPTRILFVEQHSARVRMALGGIVSTLGTVPGVQATDGERGLLGIVVDPNFPAAPYCYVHATDTRFGNKIVVSRFTLTGDLAGTGSGALAFDPASRYDLIRNLPDDAVNHNGGTVRFGPDGMLYVSLGDDAVRCNAQLVTVLAGKILRLDASRLPAGPGGPAPYALLIPPGNPFATNPDSAARLVWTLGLRNPFRFHIDPANGDLFVADVGEGTWEEVTRFSAGGLNGGWPWREGPVAFASCSGSQPAVVEPLATYSHADGVAIIGAGVYRRPASGSERFPAEYDGNYFFIDYFSGIMRRRTGSGSTWAVPAAVPGQANAADWALSMENVADVLELPDGSLVYVRESEASAALTGEIRRIAYPVTVDVAAVAPSAVSFAPPRPTPGHGHVELAWSQPRTAVVRLVLYDAGGRAVRTLVSGATYPAGTHEREWDGDGDLGAQVAPGLYFARLDVGGEIRSARIMRLR